MNDAQFTTHPILNEEHVVHCGVAPESWCPDEMAFEQWWDLHPEALGKIVIHGKTIDTPRWQQAYGRDYQFSGQTNIARALTPQMVSVLLWCQTHIDPNLNGLLLNWYDGELEHYIGPHRDSIKGLIKGTPIVTISLGASRRFRMRPYQGKGFVDFPVHHRDILIVPWSTNLAFTHEVPRSKREIGRRISITARAFL